MRARLMRVCDIADCDRRHMARGYCGLHYQRWAATGTTDLLPPRPATWQECGAEGCDRRGGSRSGLCAAHADRRRHTGSVLDPLDRRFIAKIHLVNDGSPFGWLFGCWMVGGSKRNGYSRHGGTTAHLWSYRRLIGPVPAGHELDHLCHTEDLACPGGPTCAHRACANPFHAQPVTRLTNVRRGRKRKGMWLRLPLLESETVLVEAAADALSVAVSDLVTDLVRTHLLGDSS